MFNSKFHSNFRCKQLKTNHFWYKNYKNFLFCGHTGYCPSICFILCTMLVCGGEFIFIYYYSMSKLFRAASELAEGLPFWAFLYTKRYTIRFLACRSKNCIFLRVNIVLQTYAVVFSLLIRPRLHSRVYACACRSPEPYLPPAL